MGPRRTAKAFSIRAYIALFASVLLLFCSACGNNSSNPTTFGSVSAPSSTPPAGGGGFPQSGTFVYIGQQNAPAGSGKVAGFKVNPDGSAQTTPNSPYTGSGSGLAATPAGDFVFGSDLGNVESWAVGSDGSLSRANNLAGTFGFLLMIDNSGHTLYAQELNIGGTGNNDFAFLNVGGNAALQKVGATPQSVDGGRFVFEPDNMRAYGSFCFHLDASIVGYARNSDGSLSSFNTNVSLPADSNGATFCPAGIAISPDGKNLVATLVSETSTAALTAAYAINVDGSLTPLSGSPYVASAQAKNVLFDPSGRFLLMAESDGVAAYQFTPGSAPVRMSGSPLGNAAMDRLALSRSGQQVFSISSATQSLYIFKFNSGTLTPAPGSPQTVGFVPGDLVVVQH